MVTIVIEKALTVGWKAHFSDRPKEWAYGETMEAAVGALVMGMKSKADTPVKVHIGK